MNVLRVLAVCRHLNHLRVACVLTMFCLCGTCLAQGANADGNIRWPSIKVTENLRSMTALMKRELEIASQFSNWVCTYKSRQIQSVSHTAWTLLSPPEWDSDGAVKLPTTVAVPSSFTGMVVPPVLATNTTTDSQLYLEVSFPILWDRELVLPIYVRNMSEQEIRLRDLSYAFFGQRPANALTAMPISAGTATGIALEPAGVRALDL